MNGHRRCLVHYYVGLRAAGKRVCVSAGLPVTRLRPASAAAEDDESVARVVRRYGNGDAVSWDHPDAVAPHASADLGQELHAVVALHAVVPASERLDDDALDLNEIVASQARSANTRPDTGQRYSNPERVPHD